jgi:hypothetical protein
MCTIACQHQGLQFYKQHVHVSTELQRHEQLTGACSSATTNNGITAGSSSDSSSITASCIQEPLIQDGYDFWQKQHAAQDNNVSIA